MNPSVRGPLMAVIMFALVVSGFLYYQSAQQEKHYEKTALPWVVDSLWQVSGWRTADVWPLLAPEAKEVVTKQQLDAVLAQYAPLGRFISLGDARFSRLASILSMLSSDQRIGYSALAAFENGEAVVTLVLLEREGRFYIYNINLAMPEA